MKTITQLITMVIFLLCIGCGNSSESNSNKLLPGIKIFLTEHSELGSPVKISALPDWANGQRQRIRFSNNRELLFYLENGRVTTIYEDTAEGRVKVLGDYSSVTDDNQEETKRPSVKNIPAYSIIDKVNLMSGGRYADVLIPSISKDTPLETRKGIAFAILKAERLTSLAMYSTKDAYKANFSSSFSENHPDASEGILGSITENGQFFD